MLNVTDTMQIDARWNRSKWSDLDKTCVLITLKCTQHSSLSQPPPTSLSLSERLDQWRPPVDDAVFSSLFTLSDVVDGATERPERRPLTRISRPAFLHHTMNLRKRKRRKILSDRRGGEKKRRYCWLLFSSYTTAIYQPLQFFIY